MFVYSIKFIAIKDLMREHTGLWGRGGVLISIVLLYSVFQG